MKEYQVYILRSLKHGRYYTGMSSDVTNREYFHNQGLNTSTANGIPWQRLWCSEIMSKSEALSLEKKIKKRGAERFLNDINAF